MTSTESEAASYEFTTLTCIPGVIEVGHYFLPEFILCKCLNLLRKNASYVLCLVSTKVPTYNSWIYLESLRVLLRVCKLKVPLPTHIYTHADTHIFAFPSYYTYFGQRVWNCSIDKRFLTGGMDSVAFFNDWI